jgi:hypothetical protein
VFFDALGLDWEYEREGYDLGAAGWYLPDFWLPSLKCFFEVKPSPDVILTPDALDKARSLSAHTYPVIIAQGIGDNEDITLVANCRQYHPQPRELRGVIRIGGYWVTDGDRLLLCLGFRNNDSEDGIWLDGAMNIASFVVYPPTGSPINQNLLSAYAAARAARFEHGERPA